MWKNFSETIKKNPKKPKKQKQTNQFTTNSKIDRFGQCLKFALLNICKWLLLANTYP